MAEAIPRPSGDEEEGSGIGTTRNRPHATGTGYRVAEASRPRRPPPAATATDCFKRSPPRGGNSWWIAVALGPRPVARASHASAVSADRHRRGGKRPRLHAAADGRDRRGRPHRFWPSRPLPRPPAR